MYDIKLSFTAGKMYESVGFSILAHVPELIFFLVAVKRASCERQYECVFCLNHKNTNG